MLQWELELKQSYLMDSEQTWAQRFDRVASENAALLVALHTRSDELRKLALDRIGKGTILVFIAPWFLPCLFLNISVHYFYF